MLLSPGHRFQLLLHLVDLRYLTSALLHSTSRSSLRSEQISIVSDFFSLVLLLEQKCLFCFLWMYVSGLL